MFVAQHVTRIVVGAEGCQRQRALTMMRLWLQWQLFVFWLLRVCECAGVFLEMWYSLSMLLFFASVLASNVFVDGVCRLSWGRLACCLHCLYSTEAELVALADAAIELLYIAALCEFIGLDISEAIEVNTDNKGAYDLCHRFSSAQHSRHIDRKMFKMRELRGSGFAQVNWIPTDVNPADLFTKILSRQQFEKHRKTVLNLAGDTGQEYARRTKMAGGAAYKLITWLGDGEDREGSRAAI